MKIGSPAPLEGNPARAVYAGACAGLLAFSFTFVVTATMEGLSRPWYDPLGHRWEMATVPPTPVSMDWYGRVALALLVGLAAGAITYFATRRRALPATLLRAASIWALAMTAIGLFLYAWMLANRVILPPGT